MSTRANDSPNAAQATSTGTLASRLLPACQAVFMSALVTLVAVAVNASHGASMIGAFARAWMLTLPVAVAAAYISRPVASRLATWLAGRLSASQRVAPGDADAGP